MYMLKNIFLCTFILFCFAISACKPKEENNFATADNNKEALLETDRQFANMCSQKGMKEAYLDYIDSNGVLLRPNAFPIVGADAVDFIIAQKTEDLMLTWRPKDAAVAASGELAYTYGTYKIEVKGTAENLQGSYVTIWRKQIDGKWKFVLDTNNEGLGAF